MCASERRRRAEHARIQMRVEEVPADQLNVAANEVLMPVSHYEKEPSKMFGTPFLIRVVDEEPYAAIKRRIKEALEVSDREFEKARRRTAFNSPLMRRQIPV